MEVLVLGAPAANANADVNTGEGAAPVSDKDEGVDVRTVVQELKKVRCKVFSSDWPSIRPEATSASGLQRAVFPADLDCRVTSVAVAVDAEALDQL